jgi:hypothetical protein
LEDDGLSFLVGHQITELYGHNPSSMGIYESDLHSLLGGHGKVIVASRIGVTQSDVQRFLNGHVTYSMSQSIGGFQSDVQQLRNMMDRAEAIGMVIGLCRRGRR